MIDTKQEFLVDGKLLSEEECLKIFKNPKLCEREQVCLNYIDNTSQTILDLGCYSGGFAKVLHQKFPNKTIIAGDYDEENLKIARFVHNGIKDSFRKLSAYDLDLENNSIDCVVFQEVIEHLEGAAVAVKELNRVIKMNGTLIISTPTPYYWKDMLCHFKFEVMRKFKKDSKLWDAIYYDAHEWNRHIYCWTPSTLLTLLKVNGFEYVDHSYGKDASGFFERILFKFFPFLSPTMIFKVKKIAKAPQKII